MLTISNLRYADAAHTAIDMTVSTGGEPFPFTLPP